MEHYIKKRQIQIIITSFLGVILTFVLSSCWSNNTLLNNTTPTTEDDQTHWFVDPNGHFHTYDIKLAQQEIPFTIVVPDYIPSVLGTNYQLEISGPFKNSFDNYIEVKIQYWDDNHQIYISEFNKNIIMIPTGELEPVNYEIAGIKVLRQIAQFHDSSGTTKGWGFYWNIDVLTFEVDIVNIPEEEGLKIVESMINKLYK